MATELGFRGFHICGGVLLTEIFGISSAICMFKNTFDGILFESRAGQHHLTQTEGKEQA